MGILDIFKPDDPTPIQGGDKKIEKKPTKGFTQLNNEIRDFLKADPSTRSIKDFNKLFGDISYYNAQGGYKGSAVNISPKVIKKLQNALNAQYPNRGKDDLTQAQRMRSPFFEGYSPETGKPKPFEKSDVTEAIAIGKAKKALTDAEEEEKYEGPFGKFGKYLRDNEDKRSDFFNYLGAVGARLVEPTKPGEARSFVSDLSQGLTRGKASIAAQDAAALDALVKQSEVAANIDPTQNYSSKMKEVRKEAISLGYEPGTKQYSDYVGAALRGMRVSAELEPLLDSLKIAKERQQLYPDDKGNNNIVKNLENRILALQSGTPGGGSGTKTYTYNPN